jgi:hypothetical protein
MQEVDDLSVPDAPMSDTDDDDDDDDDDYDYDKKPPALVSGKPLLSFHNNISLARSLSLSHSLTLSYRERRKANQRRFHSRYQSQLPSTIQPKSLSCL